MKYTAKEAIIKKSDWFDSGISLEGMRPSEEAPIYPLYKKYKTRDAYIEYNHSCILRNKVPEGFHFFLTELYPKCDVRMSRKGRLTCRPPEIGRESFKDGYESTRDSYSGGGAHSEVQAEIVSTNAEIERYVTKRQESLRSVQKIVSGFAYVLMKELGFETTEIGQSDSFERTNLHPNEYGRGIIDWPPGFTVDKFSPLKKAVYGCHRLWQLAVWGGSRHVEDFFVELDNCLDIPPPLFSTTENALFICARDVQTALDRLHYLDGKSAALQVTQNALTFEETPLGWKQVESKNSKRPQATKAKYFGDRMSAYCKVLEALEAGGEQITGSGELYDLMNQILLQSPLGGEVMLANDGRNFRRNVISQYGEWPGKPGPGFDLNEHIALKNWWRRSNPDSTKAIRTSLR